MRPRTIAWRLSDRPPLITDNAAGFLTSIIDYDAKVWNYGARLQCSGIGGEGERAYSL